MAGIVATRPVGKTTFARQLGSSREGPVTFFDLGDPSDLAQLEEPRRTPGGLKGLVMIVEIQRPPNLLCQCSTPVLIGKLVLFVTAVAGVRAVDSHSATTS